ncbi:hypothetical protein CR513_50585, partial [Mucuna pruriens]
MPPQQPRDHAIVLKKEGTQIPNIWPYHYLHSQKGETEKFVKDMLALQNEYILLQKGWKLKILCNNRALNNIIVPNKFPIPFIEELLDELGRGAAIFSKLDLKSGYYQIRI